MLCARDSSGHLESVNKVGKGFLTHVVYVLVRRKITNLLNKCKFVVCWKMKVPREKKR